MTPYFGPHRPIALAAGHDGKPLTLEVDTRTSVSRPHLQHVGVFIVEGDVGALIEQFYVSLN